MKSGIKFDISITKPTNVETNVKPLQKWRGFFYELKHDIQSSYEVEPHN